MTETAFSRFWELVLGAIALNPEAFELIHTLPLGTEVALSIMLITGLSHGIGQSIVLFVNRVKPIRFVLSLLIMSILYMLSSGFWLLSVWLASRLLFDQGTPFISSGTNSSIVSTLPVRKANQLCSLCLLLKNAWKLSVNCP